MILERILEKFEDLRRENLRLEGVVMHPVMIALLKSETEIFHDPSDDYDEDDDARYIVDRVGREIKLREHPSVPPGELLFAITTLPDETSGLYSYATPSFEYMPYKPLIDWGKPWASAFSVYGSATTSGGTALSSYAATSSGTADVFLPEMDASSSWLTSTARRIFKTKPLKISKPRT